MMQPFRLGYSLLQKIMGILCAALLIGVFLYIAASWGTMPDKLHGHYNSIGAGTGRDDKVYVLFCPVIGLLLYLILTVITFFPNVWSIPVATTEQSKHYIYRCMRTMLLAVKLEMILLFVWITFSMVNQADVSGYVAGAAALVIIFTVIGFVIRCWRLSWKYENG